MTYSILYVDCPWQYKDKANAGKRGAEHKYQCMSLAELIGMRPYIDSIANDNSVMFMWATGPIMPDALKVMEYWEFDYRTIAFTWIKTNPKGTGRSLDTGQPLYLATFLNREGEIDTYGDFLGMGNHTRANAEFVLLGVRGKGLQRVNNSVRSTVISPIREHSRKPAEVRTAIENLYGEQERIELFAREVVSGWDAHGLETDKFKSPE